MKSEKHFTWGFQDGPAPEFALLVEYRSFIQNSTSTLTMMPREVIEDSHPWPSPG